MPLLHVGSLSYFRNSAIDDCKEDIKLEKLKRIKKNFRKTWFFYLLPIPGIVFLVMFCYMPMAGLYLVFEKYTYKGGLFGSEFVGFDNFIFFFKNMDLALRATRNTIVLNILSIILGLCGDVAFAIIMAEIMNKGFKKVVQTVSMFPNFVSWIVVGTLSISLFHEQTGLLNRVLTAFGAEPAAWYSNPWYWWPIMLLTYLWKGVGYGSLVYYAALMGFDQGLYEAAAIDGATRLKRIWHITLPLLKPTIVIMFLLSLGGILGGSVDSMMGMTRLNPMLFETTDTLATYIYRTAIQGGQFESASAITLFQSIFGLITVVTANAIVKKIEPDYSLF